VLRQRIHLWAYHKGVVLDFSRPGKPTDNSYIESFNGKFRAGCLSPSPPCVTALRSHLVNQNLLIVQNSGHKTSL
jgi:transposase InsO family protein